SRAKEESPLGDIRPFPSGKDFPALFSDGIATIGMTFDVVPVQQLNYYTKLLPGRNFVDISPIIREIRSVKSGVELEELRFGAKKLCSVFSEVPQFLKAGMRELDLAAEFEYRLRKAGHEGYVRMRAFNQELAGGLAVSRGGTAYGCFDGAVTGKGLSCASPQGASLEIIPENEPVLLDYAGVFNGYITDMTRIFVIGSLDPRLQEAFDVAISIQYAIQQAMIPGAIAENLYLLALQMAENAGLGSCFMGLPGEQSKFVGHGVGLELDEFPILAKGFKMPLQAGQTIAVEPKFVIPGKGVIGIENTFIVSEHGGLKVTDIPDEIVFITS
ncbi:MAG: M24 family metallopeptidase, partial [Chlorobiaceae bacterium]|nr:M24 family metallopeptidase [Chlorobiaceae bacterium]